MTTPCCVLVRYRRGAPTVLIESTYGDREHPEPENLPHEGFADVIRRTIERGGSVVVPAFAIDRTEIVLKTISDLEREGRIPDVPVYVNSPMGVRALRVYQSQPDELRDDLRPEDFVKIPDLTTVESTEDSKKLTAAEGPSARRSSSPVPAWRPAAASCTTWRRCCPTRRTR